jgi:hypothetical protein
MVGLQSHPPATHPPLLQPLTDRASSTVGTRMLYAITCDQRVMPRNRHATQTTLEVCLLDASPRQHRDFCGQKVAILRQSAPAERASAPRAPALRVWSRPRWRLAWSRRQAEIYVRRRVYARRRVDIRRRVYARWRVYARQGSGPTPGGELSKSRPNKNCPVQLGHEIRGIPPLLILIESSLPSFGRDFDTLAS